MKPFLTARWESLAMLNYEIDPAILAPYVPAGTELDEWEGRTYVSLVGFLFLDTRLLGVPIPFHRDFEEVNLRFYVRRDAEDGRRRGVVFIKELVPRAAIAALARWIYNERYEALPMRHDIRLPAGEGAGRGVKEGKRRGEMAAARADEAAAVRLYRNLPEHLQSGGTPAPVFRALRRRALNRS